MWCNGFLHWYTLDPRNVTQEMMGVIREHYPGIERSTDAANDTTKWYRVPGHVGR